MSSDRSSASGATPPRSLVVVSNRLPYNIPRRSDGRRPKRNVGGLVTALEPVLVERGGCWIGWDGAPLPSRSAVAEAMARRSGFRLDERVELEGVPLSEREVGQYYHGFSNRALWPLLHDFPGLAAFHAEDYAAYERVNRRFAQVAFERAGPDSRVWVHDFQLMLVPKLLRELGFRGRIDFFLHIPFPPPEIFRALPWRVEILRGVLAADAIAFHVNLYRDNFARCVADLLKDYSVHEHAEGLALRSRDGGEPIAAAIPIGIPVDEFESVARRPEVLASARRLRDIHRRCDILFSADRLDYTKGIRERLRVLERYLVLHPESAGRVVLVQIVVPSRHQVEEYRAMKREIDREVGRINGEHGREGWMPIHYLYRALDREELVAHYLAASVALVTPLRDGMNLVASEFVASRTDEDGVLVVSEFAGVADRSPGAILVNPYDLDGCCAAIRSALTMDPQQRRLRMSTLRERVRFNPVSRWARRCLDLARDGSGAAAVPAVGVAEP